MTEEELRLAIEESTWRIWRKEDYPEKAIAEIMKLIKTNCYLKSEVRLSKPSRLASRMYNRTGG